MTPIVLFWANRLMAPAGNIKNLVGLTLGTGIGGGIMIDKKLYRGYNNIVGEFGQITISVGRRLSSWETLASGTGLINIYYQLTKKKKDALAIVQQARAGEKAAKQALQLTAHYLAIGLANIINGWGPEAIIIGGGFADCRPIWPLMLKEIKKYLLEPSRQKTKIVKSQLGERAILLGAALLIK